MECDDGGGGSTDVKHIKKSNKKFRIVAIENDDDRSKSCESDNSCFSQISSIEPQGEPELQQFSQSSSLNSEDSSSATAIDVSIKKHKQAKTKRRRSDRRQRYGNVGVQSLYHGILPLFNVIMLTLIILTRKH